MTPDQYRRRFYTVASRDTRRAAAHDASPAKPN